MWPRLLSGWGHRGGPRAGWGVRLRGEGQRLPLGGCSSLPFPRVGMRRPPFLSREGISGEDGVGSRRPAWCGATGPRAQWSLSCPHAVHMPEGHGQDLHGRLCAHPAAGALRAVEAGQGPHGAGPHAAHGPEQPRAEHLERLPGLAQGQAPPQVSRPATPAHCSPLAGAAGCPPTPSPLLSPPPPPPPPLPPSFSPSLSPSSISPSFRGRVFLGPDFLRGLLGTHRRRCLCCQGTQAPTRSLSASSWEVGPFCPLGTPHTVPLKLPAHYPAIPSARAPFLRRGHVALLDSELWQEPWGTGPELPP